MYCYLKLAAQCRGLSLSDIHCFSYVEDAPSASVARKLVAARNSVSENALVFYSGFPAVLGGCRPVKSKSKSLMRMAGSGIYSLVLTDLDTAECACSLIRDWFGLPRENPADLPSQCIFRVAVREIESWIIADRESWAEHIGIAAVNFPVHPDELSDPKNRLLSVVRKKGRRKIHREMLPRGTAHIGPRYNEVLCDFIDDAWDPVRASANSPSLKRAFDALLSL